MKDNAAIQRAIWNEFGWKPTISQIEGARHCRESRNAKFKKMYDDVKGGSGEKDRLMFDAIKIGSKLLREKIIERHPRIMKALEAHGNTVVWDG
jgi:hypothetical protein